MKQLTVRSVPPTLARALQAERKRRGTSLNQTIINLLCQSMGLTSDGHYDNGLAKLAGTWTAEELKEFEQHTAVFEQVDEELWK